MNLSLFILSLLLAGSFTAGMTQKSNIALLGYAVYIVLLVIGQAWLPRVYRQAKDDAVANAFFARLDACRAPEA